MIKLKQYKHKYYRPLIIIPKSLIYQGLTNLFIFPRQKEYKNIKNITINIILNQMMVQLNKIKKIYRVFNVFLRREKLICIKNLNNLVIISMNKNDNQSSIDKILKSRYSDKEKSKILPSNQPKKIMLTDLCPQQKLKIGQLIKLNQSRKHEIIELKEQISEIRLKFTQSHSRLIEIELQFKQKQDECNQLSQQIQQFEERHIEIEISHKKLLMENQQLKSITQKITRAIKQNKGIQTDNIKTCDFSIQTKKIKVKTRQIQVEIEEQKHQKSVVIRQNSKSFDKVMKQDHKSLKNSYSRSQKEVNHSESHSYYRNQDDEQDGNQITSNKHDTQMNQEFEDLAKELLYLKEKKVNRLKKQIKQSQVAFFKEEIAPKEFQYDQQANQSVKYTQSNEIDQNELNKMLKSKNFSACRLLSSKGLTQSSSGLRSYPERQPHYDNPNKSPFQYEMNNPKLVIGGNIKKTNQPQPQVHTKMEKIPNYYESDLMDLVDLMNN